jgi:hypothetical protein
MGNIPGMENFRRPGPPGRDPLPPVLDMTPGGEFRDPLPPAQRGWLDRILARLGGAALLVTLVTGGLLVVALAVLFVGLLLPIALGAGLIAFVSLWWRMRRLRATGRASGGGRPVRFAVLRR